MRPPGRFGLHLPSLRPDVWQSARLRLGQKKRHRCNRRETFCARRRIRPVSESALPSRIALSIQQPWAALLVSGRKTLEIRTWGTRFRGPVLIHTGKISDGRAEAWAWIDSPELVIAAESRGGIVGEASIVGCRMYRTKKGFAVDRVTHLNDPDWFQPPVMFGFEFRDARPLPFQPAKGQTKFFEVKGFPTQ